MTRVLVYTRAGVIPLAVRDDANRARYLGFYLAANRLHGTGRKRTVEGAPGV